MLEYVAHTNICYYFGKHLDIRIHSIVYIFLPNLFELD